MNRAVRLADLQNMALLVFQNDALKDVHFSKYEGNSISKLQIQVATYVFELSAGNCHR